MPQALDNPMSIGPDSDFAINLWITFQKKKPRKVIETGTWLGTGTTALIASALEDCWCPGGAAPPEDVEFFSMELNKNSVEAARKNLSGSKLDRFLRLYHGLSIPRDMLPSVEEIEARCVTALADKPFIAVEHHPRERVFKYYAETAQALEPDTEDDLLGYALEECGYKPDFVLLDSGGHMGFTEFQYVVDRLMGPCTFMLDDIQHVKHYESFSYMLEDPRFDIRARSSEKYGWCIADFTPDEDTLTGGEVIPEE